ncbi:hypothetical protein [Pedobacter sp. NJ-S-72]
MKHNMSYRQAKELLLKYQIGQCTAEEQSIVEDWITFGKVTDFKLNELDLTRNLNDLDNRLGIAAPKIKRYHINNNIAAAAILLFLGIGFYFYSSKPPFTDENTKFTTKKQMISNLEVIVPL